MQTVHYYSGTEDGEHFSMNDLHNNIFDALCDFYETINQGCQDIYQGVELGQWLDYHGPDSEMETLDFHEF